MSTTDNQQELFDTVNEQDEVIGQATRAECHSNPTLIHRTVGVFIINKEGKVLLQKRSQSKDLNPGKWTMSASGHVDSGEERDQAIQRELYEELGIEVETAEIQLVNKLMIKDNEETEFGAIYLIEHDGPFKPNTDEVERVEWYELATIYQRIAQHILSPTSFLDAALHDPLILQGLRILANRKSSQQRQLVLVDDQDQAQGQASKLQAHLDDGKQHRAFTAVVYNLGGQILVTQRSLKKPLWPTFWDISFSSHPWVGEGIEEAVRRRAFEELGLILDPTVAIKDRMQYRYHIRWNDVFSECEVNHGVVVKSVGNSELPLRNNDEIQAFKWLTVEELQTWYQQEPGTFVPWVKEIMAQITNF